MRVNKLILAELVQRLGLQGMIGIVLIVAALAIFLAFAVPTQWQLEHMRTAAQQQAEKRARGEAGNDNKPRTPAELLDAFYRTFPAETAAADSLQKIYDAAKEKNVTLPHGDYALAVDNKINLARYRIALPVRGTYEQIRGFIAAALAGVPTLALDHVDFERQKIGDSELEAKIRMTLFLKQQ